ncbi:hypothetical protein GOM49_17830 [Clostridium bovifaecis]|uniref:Teneurin-like YD-shell domain-containing protein n=1 Tax=Clostridium bovifaecis TaxID=2184719 RepID=A0A6I6ET33_9CLOT|nr:hypothetical protein GOM49_17830 [Clostridium bovifaecis]
MNLNGTEYYYIRNAQGDIIGVYDKNGIQVVSYVYDSWGKPISTTGTLASTVGAKNPYRYRGYRYDSETGLYYLQSRYYNPEWGRFINADGIIGQTGELLGHNLFIYCKNSSVNGKDPSGFKMVFADEETQRQYDQWIRTSSFTTSSVNNSRLNDIDNSINSPKGAAIISKLDGKVGGSIATGITASKKVNLDGTLGLTAHIKNPGPISKLVGGTVRATGILAVAALGIGIANNFINYEHAWDRTATDLVLFGLGVKAGLMLAALNPVTSLGTAAVIGGGILIAYGVSWLDNKIKNDYLSERKRG